MTHAAGKSLDALARLAAHYGIATAYDDAWGKSHATSAPTLRALLAAMRLPAETDPLAQLQAIEESEWRRPLPPVKVLVTGATPGIPVSLAADLGSQPHRWILTQEDGTSSSGEFQPSELTRLGETRLGSSEFIRGELRPGCSTSRREEEGGSSLALTRTTRDAKVSTVCRHLPRRPHLHNRL